MKFTEKPNFFHLNELQCRLIAPRSAFQKIFQAPRGGQLKITGNVVNVPVDVNNTINRRSFTNSRIRGSRAIRLQELCIANNTIAAYFFFNSMYDGTFNCEKKQYIYFWVKANLSRAFRILFCYQNL